MFRGQKEWVETVMLVGFQLQINHRNSSKHTQLVINSPIPFHCFEIRKVFFCGFTVLSWVLLCIPFHMLMCSMAKHFDINYLRFVMKNEKFHPFSEQLSKKKWRVRQNYLPSNFSFHRMLTTTWLFCQVNYFFANSIYVFVVQDL